jgi:ATP/maltotriose-dependent transcriptional regulator MalT
VLQLLADGLTAAAIGRRLMIAERTVQKHLQHCYAKLGVADRLGAVQRAQILAILGP